MQGDSFALDLIYRDYHVNYRLQNLAKPLINNSLFLTDSSINLRVISFINCKTTIFSNEELVPVRVFRAISDTAPQSPEREVFGIHPTTNKLLVPIDLCILINSNTSPDFSLNILNAEVLDANNAISVGKIKNFSVPPVGNIDPIVELNTDGIDLSSYFPNDIKKKFCLLR